MTLLSSGSSAHLNDQENEDASLVHPHFCRVLEHQWKAVMKKAGCAPAVCRSYQLRPTKRSV